ncbi:MAG: threonine--tRNA ligase, partial [Candidatus Kerfeldbacteria bacterium]|nr:threonine--tRNA ligase [Candidatus Kerfeldbacteria bacterium]
MPQTPRPNPDHLEAIRHTLSHLLAAAVLERYPDARLAIGPPIEHGFYYDIDTPNPITLADLPKLEQRMRELIKQKLPVEPVKLKNLAEAGRGVGNSPYKRELVEEHAGKGEPITFFRIGTFTDLCRGGHIEQTGEINPQAFKLTRVAGAYWRGDSTQPMLQRIYGVAFATKHELDQHLKLLAEAEARDHRKLGSELELFAFEPIAPGAPFWLPHGMTVIRQLEQPLAFLAHARAVLQAIPEVTPDDPTIV